MNTIIPTWIFYAISVLSNIKTALTVIGVIGVIALVIGGIVGLAEVSVGKPYGKDDEDFISGISILKQCKKYIAIIVILISFPCFIPSEKTMYTMLANSFITTDNIETFKGNAKDLADYVFDKIEGLRENQNK